MTLAAGAESIESERLVLRRIELDDFEFFSRLHADPDVARYLGLGRPRTPEESVDWMRATLATYESLSLGQLAVVRKSDRVLVGRCGLSDLAVEARPAATALPRAWYDRAAAPADIELQFECELGYTFERSQWGQGYASEAARCVFDYACGVRRLPRVVSLIHPDNVRSLRVARRFALTTEDVVLLGDSSRVRLVWPGMGQVEGCE